MRIPRNLYDALKRIKSNDGDTKEVSIHEVDALQQQELIKLSPRNETDYRLALTPRGEAAISDRPL